MKRNHDDIRVDIVRRATRETAGWAPGSPKRFVSDVYERIVADGRDGDMDLAEFKAVLLELRKRGDIELARADLIAAMPFDKVQASEIDAGGATYHFIVGDTANPDDEEDVFAEFEREAAEREERHQRERKLAETALRASSAISGHTQWGDPRMAIVSGETADREDGAMRVTFFGVDGPHGHVTRKTEEDIADEVRQVMVPPYVPMTEAEVIAWTTTPMYEIGSRKVAYTQAANSLSWYASQAGRREVYERANKLANEAMGRDPGVAEMDRALAIFHDAIRELPTRNPSRSFVRNPAWVTSALADHYEVLDDKVPPRWMPQLAGVTNNRKRLVADLVEFGCGAYGCVIATHDPKTVLKVTTDDTEAEFAAEIAPTLVAPICVEYELVVRLSSKHKGRPIHLLWRESAEQVGEIKEHGVDVYHLITVQHRAGQAAYDAIVRGKEPAAIRRLLSTWVQKVDEMSKSPLLRPLSEGLLKVWEDQHILFGDLHDGNLGLVKRDGQERWVITDPGHVAAMSDPDLWG